MMQKRILFKGGISGSTLKIIAIVIMIIDHIGFALLYRLPELSYINPETWDRLNFIYQCTRNIGRTAFPLFCFLLIEGFRHTSGKTKYAFRMLVFALLSQLPFHYAFLNIISNLNVFFTLFIGLLSIWGMDEWKKWIQKKQGKRYEFSAIFVLLGQGGILALGCVAAEGLHTDYGWNGVMLIGIFYLLQELRLFACILGYISFLWEPFCLPAFILIWFYNGKRGIGLKYTFYFIYPLHLAILYVIWRYLL